MREQIKQLIRSDGYRLSYRLWPAAGAPKATFVTLHGLMSHSGWFRELAECLTQLHFEVVGADRRGSGLNRTRRGDAPSIQALIDDVRALMEKERRDVPVYVVGWCWGAATAVNVAVSRGVRTAGLALLAPGLFPSTKVRLAANYCLTRCTCDPTVAAVPSPVNEEMFSERCDIREFIRNDPDAQRLFTLRFLQLARDMSFAAVVRLRDLSQRTLVVLAEHDAAVDNDRTVKSFLRLCSPSITPVTIPCSHAMNLEMPRTVASIINNWVTANELTAEQNRAA